MWHKFWDGVVDFFIGKTCRYALFHTYQALILIEIKNIFSSFGADTNAQVSLIFAATYNTYA